MDNFPFSARNKPLSLLASKDSLFNGTVAVYVNDLDHLNRLIDRLKKSKDIFSVERFDATS